MRSIELECPLLTMGVHIKITEAGQRHALTVAETFIQSIENGVYPERGCCLVSLHSRHEAVDYFFLLNAFIHNFIVPGDTVRIGCEPECNYHSVH